MNVFLLKYKLVFLSVIFCSLAARAGDLNLIYKRAGAFQFGTKDVWNFTMMNNGSREFQVKLNVHINSGGKDILEMTSVIFSVAPGVSDYSPARVSTGNISFYDKNNEESDRSARSLLPGHYQLIIKVLDASTSQQLDEVQEDIDVDILTPVTLTYPDNDGTISELNPSFSWLPPQPSPAAPASYRLRVVEVLNDQSAADAILRNRPLIETVVTGKTIYIYPANAPRLEQGKEYAWDVKLYTGSAVEGASVEGHVIKSDIWKFKTGMEQADWKKLPVTHSYIDLKVSSPASVFWMMDTLKVKYDDRLASGGLSIRIYDAKKNIVFDGPDYFKLHTGDNRLILNLSGIPSLKHYTIYEVELFSKTIPVYKIRIGFLNSKFLE